MTDFLFELGPPAKDCLQWDCQEGSILKMLADPYLLAQGNFD